MLASAAMLSDRLTYHPVDAAGLDAFHGLIQDEHVRRYLVDGSLFPREWTQSRVRDSQALFERRGVGLWLVHQRQTRELVGFCGFLVIEATCPEPQLVYALLERFTGRGYATEMARAAIAHARRQPGFEEILASVDRVNAASCRVLEKLRFERVETRQGAFGDVFLLRLKPSPGADRRRSPVAPR
jgi:RimJ/RimL family protein N-acetyltransferase